MAHLLCQQPNTAGRMEGGTMVMHLLRVSGSGPWTTDFDQIFGGKIYIAGDKVVWTKGAAMERCQGQATMVQIKRACELGRIFPLISPSTPNQPSLLLILLSICLWAAQPLHFIHPPFQNQCHALIFFLEPWVRVEGRGGWSLAWV